LRRPPKNAKLDGKPFGKKILTLLDAHAIFDGMGALRDANLGFRRALPE
jgi:hypothetical protein